MSKTSHIGMISLRQLLLVALVGGVFFTVVSAGMGDGGSKCPDATCAKAPEGSTCEPKYEAEDGCCPVWHCTDGRTAHGISRSSDNGSGSSSSSSSSSSGSQGGNLAPKASEEVSDK